MQEGYTLDLSRELMPIDLERWWRQMPASLKPYIEKIRTLNLDGAVFSTRPNGLLQDLHNLRRFSARNCGLSELPDHVGKMRLLETLRLSDNQIQLTPPALEQLRNMTRLQVLRLDNNPLGMVPNIERMPRLKILSLINTGIDEWPPGLFDKARPKSFFLDLGANSLSRIPDVPAGSDQARLIARTRVYEDRLAEHVRVNYERYRSSVGIPAQLTYSRAAENLLEQWPVFVDTSRRNQTAGVGTYRPEAWHDLAHERGSEGFFSVIEDLTHSADYEAGGDANDQLTDRVWRMIAAMDIDTPLREELFLMSTDPEGCEDAGAQLFNSMGVRVLASESYAYSTDGAERERKLVTLAKGAARLGQVNEIARADIKARSGNPDEVEVHLAYETGMAKDLQLPWQSEGMKFRPTAGVSNETIAKAIDTVIKGEAGDGLVNQMIELPFWERYLRDNWPGDLEANKQVHMDKLDLLEDLKAAQMAWAQSRNLPPMQRVLRRRTLLDLAEKFSLAEKEVFTGAAMNTETYDRLLREIGYQEKELRRQLTREALLRAGI